MYAFKCVCGTNKLERGGKERADRGGEKDMYLFLHLCVHMCVNLTSLSCIHAHQCGVQMHAGNDETKRISCFTEFTDA